jgi:hypothetical protein
MKMVESVGTDDGKSRRCGQAFALIERLAVAAVNQSSPL